MPSNHYHDTCVVEFHEAFGAPIAWAPGVPDFERRKLRVELLLEEVFEFMSASGLAIDIDGKRWNDIGLDHYELVERPAGLNLVDAADALADIRYVAEGAALEWGIPLAKCFAEVHRSNMSKLGADGKPIYRADGKVLKGPHYSPPQLETLLALWGWVANGPRES